MFDRVLIIPAENTYFTWQMNVHVKGFYTVIFFVTVTWEISDHKRHYKMIN